jgi:hypothetical protein
MTDPKPHKPKHRFATKACLLLVLLGGLRGVCGGQTTASIPTLGDIALLVESGNASDEVVASSIALRLESLRGKQDNQSNTEKAQLVRIAATIPREMGGESRSAALASRARALAKVSGVEAPANLEGASLLYVAAGIAAMAINQERLVGYAADPANSPAVRLVVLEAVLSQPQILPGIRERLLGITGDDWSFVDPNDAAPAPNAGTLVYPLRNIAALILHKLDAQEAAAQQTATPSEHHSDPEHSTQTLEPAPVGNAPQSLTEEPLAAEHHQSLSLLASVAVVSMAAMGLFWILRKRRK